MTETGERRHYQGHWWRWNGRSWELEAGERQPGRRVTTERTDAAERRPQRLPAWAGALVLLFVFAVLVLALSGGSGSSRPKTRSAWAHQVDQQCADASDLSLTDGPAILDVSAHPDDEARLTAAAKYVRDYGNHMRSAAIAIRRLGDPPGVNARDRVRAQAFLREYGREAAFARHAADYADHGAYNKAGAAVLVMNLLGTRATRTAKAFGSLPRCP